MELPTLVLIGGSVVYPDKSRINLSCVAWVSQLDFIRPTCTGCNLWEDPVPKLGSVVGVVARDPSKKLGGMGL